MGQISERFRVVSKTKELELKSDQKEYNKKRDSNKEKYNFDASIYPILSNKAYRNTIEHIDEYNVKTIKSQNGVGGFNYIDRDTPEKLKQTLLSNRHNHIYTLDLISGKVYITRDKKELSFSINELRIELAHLDSRVNQLNRLLSDIIY
jgi:hypothetical protein